MPRAKTKSPPIQFRIAAAQHERLITRAENVDQTVPQYVAALVEKHLGPIESTRPAGAPCGHPRSKVSLIGGGLAKCSCGALRNMRGEWS